MTSKWLKAGTSLRQYLHRPTKSKAISIPEKNRKASSKKLREIFEEIRRKRKETTASEAVIEVSEKEKLAWNIESNQEEMLAERKCLPRKWNSARRKTHTIIEMKKKWNRKSSIYIEEKLTPKISIKRKKPIINRKMAAKMIFVWKKIERRKMKKGKHRENHQNGRNHEKKKCFGYRREIIFHTWKCRKYLHPTPRYFPHTSIDEVIKCRNSRKPSRSKIMSGPSSKKMKKRRSTSRKKITPRQKSMKRLA